MGFVLYSHCNGNSTGGL
eukprot:CCRYP_014261-RA/>CCRYP_014261-RA protein AED:0.42 eAED:1.00 QI:0/-1/0/1/-1/0/1/0/17